jgi:hypothetical protein
VAQAPRQKRCQARGRLEAVGGAHMVAAARVEGVALEPVPLVAAAPPVPRRSSAVAARSAPHPLVAVAARHRQMPALVRRQRRRARTPEAGALAQKLALGEEVRRNNRAAHVNGWHRLRRRGHWLRRRLDTSDSS